METQATVTKSPKSSIGVVMTLQRVSVKRYVRRKPDRRSEIVERGIVTDPRRIDYGIILQKRKVRMRYSLGEGPAIVKQARADPRGIEMEEAVTSTIDTLLGFDVVPPATARFGEKVAGVTDETTGITIQEWVPNSKTLDSYAEIQEEMILLENQDRVFKIAVLDFIIAQKDRHSGNFVVERKTHKLWAIDHHLTFVGEDDGYFHPSWVSYNFKRVQNQPIPPAIMKQLKELQEGDLRAAVAPLGPQAVKGAVARWKLLKKHKRMPIPYPGEPWRKYFGRGKSGIIADT